MSPDRLSAWGGASGVFGRISRPRRYESAQIPRGKYLAHGNGRSYGDTCLPSADSAIHTLAMHRVLSFDPEQGILRAEAGITLDAIIDIIVPHGWFLPVTPGTKYVTLGGAIANDVHGKNHHNAGTFGCFVTAFELIRSDGSRLLCTREQNAGHFAAAIGGMGLTGLIAWAEIRLMKVASSDVEQVVTPFANIDEYFARGEAGDNGYTYSVAWIDGLASGRNLGRGLVMRANHASNGSNMKRPGRPFQIPLTPPCNTIPRLGLKALNALYLHAQLARPERRIGCDPYFYPLDGIGGWNRLYGSKGFRQFQCVVPPRAAPSAISLMLEESLAREGGSGLVVLKRFGGIASPGLLSFPMEGYTLTLDFPDRGERTQSLFDALTRLALDAGGRINPYKDSRMSRETFELCYAKWLQMRDFLDPHAESRFSRRLGLAMVGAPDMLALARSV